MAGDFLSGLANIGEVVQGADRAGYNDILRQLAMQQIQERRMQMLQQQREQGIGQGIGGLIGKPGFQQLLQGLQGGGGQQQMPQQPPQMPGAGAAGGFAPQLQPQGAAGVQGMAGTQSGPSLPSLIAQMESSGGTQNASQPPGMANPTYGQYPGFTQQYGSGASGVNNFAQRMLSQNPNATIGDYYSNYVLGTGNPNKTTADLANTSVPGARGAYGNMETKLASAGVSDVTPLKNFVQNMPPEQKAQVDAGTQNAVRRIPDILQTAGRWDVAGLAKLIDEQSPDPEVKAGMFLKLYPLLSSEAKAQASDIFKGYQAGATESRFVTTSDERARHDRAMEEAGANKGSPFQPTDAEGKPMGPPMSIQGNRATPIQGLPEGTGLTRVGTKPAGGNVSDMQAEWVASYIQSTGSWPVGSGRNQQLQNKVEQLLAQKGVDPQKIAQASGTFKADSGALAQATKLTAATESYEATALKNLDVATKLIHQAAPTDWGPAINKWIETGETFVGSTTVPPSVAAVVTLANEYAKVMSGATGAAAPAEGARAEAARILNPYFSSGQWDSVVDKVIKPDMNNRIESLYNEQDIIQSRIGRGGQARRSPTPEAATTGGGDMMPVPDAYKNESDGTAIRNKQTGQVWTKKGNQMILTPGGEPTPEQQ